MSHNKKYKKSPQKPQPAAHNFHTINPLNSDDQENELASTSHNPATSSTQKGEKLQAQTLVHSSINDPQGNIKDRSLEEENENLVLEQQTLRDEIMNLNEKVKEATNNRSQEYKQELERSEAIVKALTEKQVESQTKNNTVQLELKKEIEKNETLTLQLKESDRKANQLKEQNSALQNENDRFCEEIRTLKKQMTGLSTLNKQLTESNEEVKSQILTTHRAYESELQLKLNTLLNEKDEISKQLELEIDKNVQLQKEMAMITTEKQPPVDTLLKEIGQYKTKATEYMERVRELEEENKQLKREQSVQVSSETETSEVSSLVGTSKQRKGAGKNHVCCNTM